MGALIELKNIGYSYHNLAGETGAIKDVSFQVEEGEDLSGYGKTGVSLFKEDVGRNDVGIPRPADTCL